MGSLAQGGCGGVRVLGPIATSNKLFDVFFFRDSMQRPEFRRGLLHLLVWDPRSLINMTCDMYPKNCQDQGVTLEGPLEVRKMHNEEAAGIPGTHFKSAVEVRHEASIP